MEKSEVKSIIIVVLALLVILLGTCEVNQQLHKKSEAAKNDTLSYSLYRQEKQQQIRTYEKRIDRLQKAKDSLWLVAVAKKTDFTTLRPKVRSLQTRLKEKISQPDSNCIYRDSLRIIADSLFVYQDKSDTTCIETINALEQVVANRDSCISIQSLVTSNLRDIQKEQDLKAQYLTDQLNIALKVQRKKARQNKILSGGILLLSGITTAVLIPHYLK